MARVAYFDHPAFDWHEGPAGHPERPARQASIRRHLTESGLAASVTRLTPTPVDRALLGKVHDDAYIEKIERFSAFGRGQLDADTYVTAHSLEAALLAAGAVADAVSGVLAGTFERAFCSVRPPGHHASRERGMGFCLFNNVVVGAQRALDDASVDRVAILDFDVHHGNGTQDLTYHRGDVFFASTHQFPAYPGTGSSSERGAGSGLGTNLNVPLPPGADDRALLSAWEEEIRPALDAFEPQFLLISAGFDADARDPLAELEVSSQGFEALTSRVVRWAKHSCQGRIVSTLEGGYDLDALGEDVVAHLRALCSD